MYGWDSYFIQVGLLRDGELSLAEDRGDNFLYEIRNYGKILNANRTSYLTRCQPQFLTEMILAVYRRSMDVSASIGFGYRSNEIGFGWTNAAFEELYPQLPPGQETTVLKLDWH